MGAEPPFLYDKPSSHSFVSPIDRGFQPKAVTRATTAPSPPKPPKTDRPLINSRDVNRHPDSYLVVPHGNLKWKPLAPHTKSKVKWLRILLLFLYVCSWIGAVGLLVCVICIKPSGDIQDWLIWLPPGIALLHLTYAIYHLSRPAVSRTPASSSIYMVFASICNAAAIAFFVIIAIFAHDQLFNQFSSGEKAWHTLLGSDELTHTIVLSIYITSLVTGSLLVIGLCISIYLAFTFHKISRLPPDMNLLEDNLTSRHKRNKSSISMDISEPVSMGPASPLIGAPLSMPFMQTRNDARPNISNAQRRPPASNSGLNLEMDAFQAHRSPRMSRINWAENTRPGSSVYSEGIRTPNSYSKSPTKRPNSTQSGSEYALVGDEKENRVPHLSHSSHPSSSPSLPQIPPELRHLRNFNPKQSHRASPPIALDLIKQDKYASSNGPPQPLGMNPPTPRYAPGQQRSPEVRALRESRDNSASPQLGNFPWEDIRLNSETPKGPKRSHQGKKYGAVQDEAMSMQMGRGQTRVVSSGVEAAPASMRGAMRARDVSGKIAEEGRAIGNYRDF